MSNIVQIFLYPSLAAIQLPSQKIPPQLQAACQISVYENFFWVHAKLGKRRCQSKLGSSSPH